MHVLGLANGTPDGNSEIALKIALTAAQDFNPSITTSWIHVPSVSIPRNPKPLADTLDLSLGHNPAMTNGKDPVGDADDRAAILEAFMNADAIIFATPIYSHSPAGFLKAMVDRIFGPFTDRSFATMVLEGQKNGEPQFAGMKVDMRMFKPRVAGFITVGGSTTPDQITMALPILHTLIYPMHVKVVDQVCFQGIGTPGALLTAEGGAYKQRAHQLGRNVASQIGKEYDDAKFLGPEPQGSCPYCHLAKVDMFGGKENMIGCIACGAQGHLTVNSDGVILPVWNNPCGVSSLTMPGKTLHVKDIGIQVVKEAQDIKDCKDFEEQRKKWRNVQIPLVKLPSQ